MRLVPVDDELFLLAIGDNILAHAVRFTIRIVQNGVIRRLKDPAGARQAVFGRVNGLAGSLGWKITDKKTDWHRRLILGIDPRKKVASAKALDEIEARAEEEVVKAVEFAEASPEPAMAELYTDIYADN